MWNVSEIWDITATDNMSCRRMISNDAEKRLLFTYGNTLDCKIIKADNAATQIYN